MTEQTHEDEAGQVRDLATRGTPIGRRIRGLEAALAAARGRLDDDLLDDVARTVERTTGRLRLSAQHTVVGIAGATGSGKSSTYNALVGLELSSVGVRRPTTSWATAVVWGSEGAGELLEWLGIPPRHQTMRDSMLDSRPDDNVLGGVVLMDLPDHDSTEVAHHLEVDRLVELADLLVWVVDPQKYADAALHDRYLKPLAGHQDVMVIAVNHIDTIAEEKRDAMVEDVRRLLAEDGLDRVKVVPISAREGIGMDDLRREISDRVDSKRAAAERVEADVAAVSRRLAEAGGALEVRPVDGAPADDLVQRTEGAAGIPVLVDAIERSVSARARRATTWPPLALLGRSAGGELAEQLGGVVELSGSVPKVAPVQRGALHTGIREFADSAARGMSPAWERAVRSAATASLEDTGHRLDRRLRGVDLGVERLPAWVGLFRVLQWLLFLVALGGGAWWALSETGVVARASELGGIPLPAVLLGAGLVIGLVLGVVGRALAGGAAGARAEAAEEALGEAVASVLDEQVIGPVRSVTDDYVAFCTGLEGAVG